MQQKHDKGQKKNTVILSGKEGEEVGLCIMQPWEQQTLVEGTNHQHGPADYLPLFTTELK